MLRYLIQSFRPLFSGSETAKYPQHFPARFPASKKIAPNLRGLENSSIFNPQFNFQRFVPGLSAPQSMEIHGWNSSGKSAYATDLYDLPGNGSANFMAAWDFVGSFCSFMPINVPCFMWGMQRWMGQGSVDFGFMGAGTLLRMAPLSASHTFVHVSGSGVIAALPTK